MLESIVVIVLCLVAGIYCIRKLLLRKSSCSCCSKQGSCMSYQQDKTLPTTKNTSEE